MKWCEVSKEEEEGVEEGEEEEVEEKVEEEGKEVLVRGREARRKGGEQWKRLAPGGGVARRGEATGATATGGTAVLDMVLRDLAV